MIYQRTINLSTYIKEIWKKEKSFASVSKLHLGFKTIIAITAFMIVNTDMQNNELLIENTPLKQG